MTAHLNIIGGQKVSCQAECDDFGASVIFPDLVAAPIYPASATKYCSGKTLIYECQACHCRSDESTNKSSMDDGRSVSLSKESTLKEMFF
jgi:hypothetical protein